MTPASLLTLDIARRVGWAYCNALPSWPATLIEARAAASGRPAGLRSGADTVAPEGLLHGPLMIRFEDWIRRTLDQHQPDAVVFEAPFGTMDPARFESTRRLVAMTAVAELECERRSLPVYEVSNNSWKKHFVGSGRATKPEVIRACVARGWTIGDDNEADAIGLLDYSVSILRKRSAAA